tara:strand:- start:18470 stop:19300 length:831 start_codon:yes stop_codon:yes gene_type:complete
MKHNALTLSILDKINSNALTLPTLPDIALRVKQTAELEDSTITDVSQVVATDAALTTRILRYSNTVLVRGVSTITDIHEACKRIGLVKLKNLAIGMAMEQLFDSKNKQIQIKMHEVWMDTVTMTSCAMGALEVCAKQKHIREETLFLACLAHNIGMLAILNEAETNPSEYATDAFLNETANRLSPILGGQILKQWEFEQPVIYAVEHWRRRETDESKKRIDYVDYLRLGAALNGYYGEKQDRMIKHCKSKGMFKHPDLLECERYHEISQAVLASFI